MNTSDWLPTYDWLVVFALIIRRMDSLLEYHDIRSCHMTCVTMRDAFVTEVWADIVFMQATLPGTPIPLRVLSLMKDRADNNAVTVMGHVPLGLRVARAMVAEDRRRTANGARWYRVWGSTNPMRRWTF